VPIGGDTRNGSTLKFSTQSDLGALVTIPFEIVPRWQPFAHLSPTVFYGVMLEQMARIDREVWTCLETEQCRRAARETFFGQLLWWLRKPPWHAALEASVCAMLWGAGQATRVPGG
jgi:hypothetical protein